MPAAKKPKKSAAVQRPAPEVVRWDRATHRGGVTVIPIELEPPDCSAPAFALHPTAQAEAAAAAQDTQDMQARYSRLIDAVLAGRLPESEFDRLTIAEALRQRRDQAAAPPAPKRARGNPNFAAAAIRDRFGVAVDVELCTRMRRGTTQLTAAGEVALQMGRSDVAAVISCHREHREHARRYVNAFLPRLVKGPIRK